MVTAITDVMIGDRVVGPGHPCFIIAEAGVNHNGSLEMARQLVDIAVQAGADAVKFQTFKAERLANTDAPKAAYQENSTDAGESQFEMISRLELSPARHRDLKAYCEDIGILFMSSPFDEESADLLADLDVTVFKIPSGEITNLTFLDHVAQKGQPMIVSTGMSTLSEVAIAVDTIHLANNRNLILLHCISNYPADPADVNLKAMATMATAFQVPVGYSDHTNGVEVALAAVALGACVIEKHFTLDRNLPGPDHLASLEPKELDFMVRGIRTVEISLGHGRKEPAASETNTAAVARKSLVTTQDIPAGQRLTKEYIAVKRPGTGLPPSMISHVLGRTIRVAVPAGTLITLEMLA
jgi:N,N'-diacetyllegionaminate synthase